MNKKAVNEMIGFIIGLLKGAVVVVALVAIIYIIWPKSTNQDITINEFYFRTLVKDIKDLTVNSIKTTTILVDDEHVLIGFSRNINKITVLNEQCGKANVVNEINKPISCQGNSCLCLCEISESVFGSDLTIDCGDRNSKCEQFSEDITGGANCNYFLYYSPDNRLREIEINKVLGGIIIKTK